MEELLTRFRKEYSGILNWAIEGLKDYRRNGLHVFARCIAASEEYRDSEDVLSEFLHTTLREPNASTLAKELYTAYQFTATGRTLTLRAFNEALRERGFSSRKTMNGIVFDGIVAGSGLL